MLHTLISKLPISIDDKWYRWVQFKCKNQVREPDFEVFIKFVDEKPEMVNDPLYSQEAVDQNTGRKERKRKIFIKRDRQFKTLTIQLQED